MKIVRDGKEYELTKDEVYQARKECIIDFYIDEAVSSFDIDKDDARDIAERAYDIYCEGNGDTEYEALEKAANEYNDTESKRLYEVYCLDWMIEHGYTLKDIAKICKEFMVESAIDGTLDSDMNIAFDDMIQYFNDNGFNGECFACYEEFLESEYADAEYRDYLKDRMDT